MCHLVWGLCFLQNISRWAPALFLRGWHTAVFEGRGRIVETFVNEIQVEWSFRLHRAGYLYLLQGYITVFSSKHVSWIVCSECCLTNGSSHANCHGGSCGERSPCHKCPMWPVEQSPTDSLQLCGSTRRIGDCPGVCPAPETSWWQEIPLPAL